MNDQGTDTPPFSSQQYDLEKVTIPDPQFPTV